MSIFPYVMSALILNGKKSIEDPVWDAIFSQYWQKSALISAKFSAWKRKFYAPKSALKKCPKSKFHLSTSSLRSSFSFWSLVCSCPSLTRRPSLISISSFSWSNWWFSIFSLLFRSPVSSWLSVSFLLREFRSFLTACNGMLRHSLCQKLLFGCWAEQSTG